MPMYMYLNLGIAVVKVVVEDCHMWRKDLFTVFFPFMTTCTANMLPFTLL